MYPALTGVIYASALLLLIVTWISGSKASRLLFGGSPERMQRKARKLLVWCVYTTLPALSLAAAILAMAGSMDSVFWEDRLLLHLPLTVIPLLAIWLLTMPRLYKIWQAARHHSDGPLPSVIRLLAAHPLVILPFQAAAMSAAVALYFSFVSPVPLELSKVIGPFVVLAAAIGSLWLVHDRRWQRISRSEEVPVYHRGRRALRGLGIFSAVLGIALFALLLERRNSLLPAQLSMAEGPMEFGGGTALAHDSRSDLSIAMLTGPRDRAPDRKFTLTAEKKTVKLGSGETVEAWTYNGQLPGPELRIKQGELVEVTLINRDIEEGATVHWHGLDVPNAEDGVAGVTQDAVMPGEQRVYRFVAEQTGTYWYHSHQDSQEAVKMGLFGSLIVEPREPAETSPTEDITVMTHVWKEGGLAIGDDNGIQRKQVTPGTPVRIRLINTQDWVRQKYTLVGTPFRVSALDGTELNKPTDLENVHIVVTTGGRADLTFLMPDHPVFLSVGNSRELGILLSRDGTGNIPDIPATEVFDPLGYGSPAPTPIGADSPFDREFEVILDNKLGFFNGQFDSLYTLNGEVFPDAPMFMVREGDLVKTTIVNRGAVDHPMHLHGHHLLVLSRNGEPSTGSPIYSDTLDVQPGDTYQVAFVADNPGLWMDHCHNLTHARAGMSMHLMYEGVTSPYTVGTDTINHPE